MTIENWEKISEFFSIKMRGSYWGICRRENGEGKEKNVRLPSFKKGIERGGYFIQSLCEQISLTSSTKCPTTSSFSSLSSSLAILPLGRPMEDLSRKKLLPASAPSVILPSMMVKVPNPGRTRFFKISVPTALALIRQTLEASRAAWPCSPQRLGEERKKER